MWTAMLPLLFTSVPALCIALRWWRIFGLQWLYSKLVKKMAVFFFLAGTKVWRFLNKTSLRTCSLLVEKGYEKEQMDQIFRMDQMFDILYNTCKAFYKKWTKINFILHWDWFFFLSFKKKSNCRSRVWGWILISDYYPSWVLVPCVQYPWYTFLPV